MKTPAQRLTLVAALSLGVVVVAVWLAIGRRQAPPLPTGNPVAAANPPAVSPATDGKAPPAQPPGQARELIDAIRQVLASGKSTLSAQEQNEILSLPNNDPRKKLYLSESLIRDMAENFPKTYAGLFQQLGLDAEGIQLMTNLLIGRQLLLRETSDHLNLNATRIQVSVKYDAALGGPNGMGAMGNTADLSDVPQRRTEALAQVEAEISNLLGPGKYALYDGYMKAEPAVKVVDNFQDRLKDASATGLSESQTTQMLAVVLAEQTPLSGFYRMNRITDNVVQAGQTFLSPAQQAVLERFHWENKQLDDAIVAAVEAKRRENAAAGK